MLEIEHDNGDACIFPGGIERVDEVLIARFRGDVVAAEQRFERCRLCRLLDDGAFRSDDECALVRNRELRTTRDEHREHDENDDDEQRVRYEHARGGDAATDATEQTPNRTVLSHLPYPREKAAIVPAKTAK